MQARPNESQHFGKEAFDKIDNTEIRWLGNSGILINSKGICIMIDPVLSGFDMPMLIDMPIKEEEVPCVDAMLITHCDNDHFCLECQNKLKGVVSSYHTTKYVANLFKDKLDICANGYNIGETFTINDIKASLTPADHDWQNYSEKHHTREFKKEDYCGFYIETKDGTIWNPGDTRFMEKLLQMESPDVILLDFSDSRWHIGFDNAVKLCNHYKNSTIIPIHWGSVDAENWKEFNGNPWLLKERIINPNRLLILNPGNKIVLQNKIIKL